MRGIACSISLAAVVGGTLALAAFAAWRLVRLQPERPTAAPARARPGLVPQAGHRGPVESVGFSLDSRWLLTAGAGEVKIWDARTGELLQTITAHRVVTKAAL